ncbi:MAG: hypothetical protein ABIN36_16785 [Ferruginibacter sp.]
MQNTIHHPHAFSSNVENKLTLTGFYTWCAQQETNRLLWLAISMLIQSCILVPATWFALYQTDKSILYFIIPMLAIVMCLVINLAALPTKITIPVFVLSIVMDLVILAACFL